MKTLYDLLGALPDDDAAGLRTAFRKAVKGAHPDINPGDPDAALKFRQIVNANEILSDEEQRAAYDHLLDLARLEQESASKHAVAAAIHKVASGTMALAGALLATIGGYLLFTHISAASVAPPNQAEIAREPSQIAAATSARDANGQNASRAQHESAPKFSAAYLDPDFIFYHPQKFDGAFADTARAKRIEKAGRTGPARTIARTQRVEPRVKPVFSGQTAERDLSREEGFLFVTVH
jgi:curved DNA-binding protein CbpA